jgi:hypothetical protein
VPALKGSFTADFAPFVAEVEKATVKLEAFESSTQSVDESLSAMVNKFSGVKVISEATLMAEAVERIGGVSKLTADELERVGKVAQEAVAKFNAMGGDAPTKIQALADAAHGATDANKTWADSFVALGTSMFGQVAAAEIVVDIAKAVGQAFLDAGAAALQYIADVTMAGGKVADVQDSFLRLTEQVGLLSTTLLGDLRQGTQGMVTDFDLMRGANQAMIGGVKLTEEQFGTLGQAAVALASATGKEVPAAYETMVNAMVKGQGSTLAAIGVKYDAATAEKNFKASLDDSQGALTEEGKLQAHRVGLYADITAALDQLGSSQVNVAGRVEQSRISWQNFSNDLGAAINHSEAINIALQGVGDILIEAFGGSREALIENIVSALNHVVASSLDVAKYAIAAGGAFVQGWIETKAELLAVATNVDVVIAALLKAYDLVLKVKSHTTEMFDDTNAAKQAAVAVALDLVNKRIGERAVEMAKIPAQQAAVDASTQHLIDRFADLAGRVHAAADAADKETTATTAGGAAHTAAAGQVETHAGSYTKLSQEQIAQQKLEEKAATEATKLWAQYYDLVDSRGGTTTEKQIAHVTRWFEETVAKLQAAGIYNEQTADAVYAVWTAKMAGVGDAQAKVVERTTQEAERLWNEYDALLVAHGGTAMDQRIAQVDRWYEDTVDKLQRAGLYNEQTATAVWAVWQEKLAGIQVNWSALTKTATEESREGLQQTADIAQATYQEALTHVGEWSDGAIEKYRKTAEAAQLAADNFGTGFEENAKKATKAVDDTAAKVEEAAQRIQSTFSFTGGSTTPVGNYGALTTEQMMSMGLVDMYHNLTARGAQAGYGYGPLGGGTSFGGFRAEGGPVAAGQRYVVGEKGPELFIPSTSGRIVNSEQMSNIFNIVDTESNIARRVSEHLMRSLMGGRRFSA